LLGRPTACIDIHFGPIGAVVNRCDGIFTSCHDLPAAILVALRKRDGGTVVGEGAPARWRLREA
jgi:hypothetical protein